MFAGAIYSRGALAEVGAPLVLPHAEGLGGTEGLVLRVLGDGHPYTMLLRTAEGNSYAAKFQTREGYSSLRLPFNLFRPLAPDAPPLEPGAVVHLGVRFESRIRALEQVVEPGQSAVDVKDSRFKLEVDWIKALPGGQETDVVLVSCAGVPRPGAPARGRWCARPAGQSHAREHVFDRRAPRCPLARPGRRHARAAGGVQAPRRGGGAQQRAGVHDCAPRAAGGGGGRVQGAGV